MGTRVATVGPQLAYAPVLNSPLKFIVNNRPSASAARLPCIRAGCRLVVATMDS